MYGGGPPEAKMSEISTYDPRHPLLRSMLALSIVNRLDEAGFVEANIEEERSSTFSTEYSVVEKVYCRDVDGAENCTIKVYTTVVGGYGDRMLEVRASGKDAIRVCLVYKAKDGRTRGLSKERRVNRTGDIDAIVERMVVRMRDAWRTAKTGKRCSKCGAPKFVTKAGGLACAEICWVPEAQKRDTKREQALQNSW